MLKGTNTVTPNNLTFCFCLRLVKSHEERQLAWDQREVELERRLDQYEKHQDDILSGAEKVH